MKGLRRLLSSANCDICDIEVSSSFPLNRLIVNFLKVSIPTHTNEFVLYVSLALLYT